MRNSTTRSILGVAILATIFSGAVSAQNGRSGGSRPAKPAVNVPMVQDWSTRQVAFRNPMTPEEARSKNQMQRWQRLASDPRYMLALTRKLEHQVEQAERRSATSRPRPNPIPGPSPAPAPAPESSVHRDWSMAQGGGGGTGIAGTYPAKYSFNINAAPSCTNDFVVYPTGAAGANDGAGSHEVSTGNFTANDDVTGTIIIGAGGRATTFTASTTDNTGLNFQVASGTSDTVRNQKRDNLVLAINRFRHTIGVTAAPTANVGELTITANTDGPTNIPTSQTSNGARFSGFSETTNGTLTAGQPSVIAFNQLYNTTCNASRTNPNPTTHPDVYWAYNTGGTVRTSPVISYFDNGLQVAFVQTVGTQAELVLLKWKAGQGSQGAPATPATAANGGDYRNGTGACAGGVSCMLRIDMNGTANVTYSSVFVDYFANTAYVGDDAGVLHKFTGIFSASTDAAEVTTGGFPRTVSAGNALSPPVTDFNGSVFVGSARGATTGGMLHKVNTADGTVTNSAQLAANSSPGVRASPVLDVFSGKVYAMVFNDGSPGGDPTTATCNTPCRAVYQFNTGSFPGTPIKVTPGRGNGATRVMYNGTFDSAWYNSVDGTGSLYVTGGAPGDATDATLWKIPITAGVMGTTPVQGPTYAAGSAGDSSPITQIRNGSNEYLFFSTPDNGNAAGCTGACVYMYNLSNLQAASGEVWNFNFPATQVNNGTITVNSVTFTGTDLSPDGSNTCTPTGGSFDVFQGGGAAADGASLRACLTGNIPGFTVGGSGSVVTITRTAPGNVAGTLVTETMDVFALTSNVDGVLSTDLTTGSTTSAGLAAPGGTSAIVIDNISGTAGASQVYYNNLTAPSNAIQASQSGLQ